MKIYTISALERNTLNFSRMSLFGRNFTKRYETPGFAYLIQPYHRNQRIGIQLSRYKFTYFP